MKIKLFTVFSWILFLSCAAQKDNLQQDNVLRIAYDLTIKAQSFEVDKLGRVFVVDNKNQVHLYGPDFQKLYTYNSNRLGQISSIDVSNPQKVLLYYNSFDVIVLLDAYLAVTNTIDLKQFDFTNIPVVCLSNDNNIWFYNPSTFKLHKIDDQGNEMTTSFSLVDQNLGHVEPIQILESDNKVFMNDPNVGILVFDNLGQFVRLLPVQDIKDFYLDSKTLLFKRNDQFYLYSLKAFAERQIQIPSDLNKVKLKQVRIFQDFGFYLDNLGIVRRKN